MPEAIAQAPPQSAPPSSNPANGIPVDNTRPAPDFVQRNSRAREEAISKLESSKGSFLDNLNKAAAQDETAKISSDKDAQAKVTHTHPSVNKEEKKAPDKPDPTAEEKKTVEKKVEKPKSKDPLERLEQSVEGEESTEEKVEEKSTEKTTEEEKPLTKWKELKAKADRWDEYEKSGSKWESENKELREKLESYEKANRINDYENLNKEHGELKKKLAEYDIQHSDEYKENVKVPYENYMGKLKEYAKTYEMDETKLIAASDLRTDAERDAALEDIIESSGKKPLAATIAKLTFMLEDVAKINEFRETMFANAERASESIKLQRERVQAENDSKRQENFRETGEAVLGRLQKPFKELFSNPEFAKEVKDGFTTPDKLPESLQAYSVYAGKILPAYQEWANGQIKDLKSEVASLKAIIEKRNGAAPGVDTHGTRDTSNDKSDSHLTFEQRLAQAAQRDGL